MGSFERFDTITGEVIDHNSHGCYVRDDKSGFVVFYYGNGGNGDKVQLTVRKVNPEAQKVTCVLDSVLEYGEIAA